MNMNTKIKNIFTKAIALTVTLAMLILATGTASTVFAVSAEDGDAWTAPVIPFETLKKSAEFTDTDAAQLAEALTQADFLHDTFTKEEYLEMYRDKYHREANLAFAGQYDFINLQFVKYNMLKEQGYDIRHIDLKYGYYIDIVFVSQPQNGESAYGSSSAYIRNKDGYVLAEITMTSDFIYGGTKVKTVKSTSQKIAGKSYVSQITFSDDVSNGGAENSAVTITNGEITMKIKSVRKKTYGEYGYNAQITCDIYGNAIQYFSWKQPWERFSEPLGDSGLWGSKSRVSIISDPPYMLDDINILNEPKFTDKDATKLAEALFLIDFSKIELIDRGKNYDIKRIQMKYGYYIDIIFSSYNDNVTSDYNYNKTGQFTVYNGSSPLIMVFIRDSKGCVLANMELTAVFSAILIPKGESVSFFESHNNSEMKEVKYEKSTAKISFHNAFADSDIPQITFTKKSRGKENATDLSSIVDGVFTLSINDGTQTKSFTFNMQLECYFNGITTAWVK